MAVPRDVDPDAAGVAGVHLLNIDDLQRVAEANREGREAFVPAAEQIIAEEVRATAHALDARESAPTVQALVNRVERLRDGVLERHLARVPATDVETREAMRELADALTAKFLHGPIRALRESPDPTLDAAVINDAFELKGLITVKDITKQTSFPNAARDSSGRLRVGAAVGVGEGTEERVEALVKAGVDVIVVDTAHGHGPRRIRHLEAWLDVRRPNRG